MDIQTYFKSFLVDKSKIEDKALKLFDLYVLNMI
jgi:hypothetical protein